MKKVNKLEKYRKDIDELDKKIISLLIKRFGLVRNIGKYKKDNHIKITNKVREKEIINNITKYCHKNIKISERIINIYNKIFKESCSLQCKED